jgi:hypothetical protein
MTPDVEPDPITGSGSPVATLSATASGTATETFTGSGAGVATLSAFASGTATMTPGGEPEPEPEPVRRARGFLVITDDPEEKEEEKKAPAPVVEAAPLPELEPAPVFEAGQFNPATWQAAKRAAELRRAARPAVQTAVLQDEDEEIELLLELLTVID